MVALHADLTHPSDVHLCYGWVGCRYPELEGRQLGGEMAAVPLPDAVGDDIEAVVAGLGASADAATALVHAAAERCSALTGATPGTSIPDHRSIARIRLRVADRRRRHVRLRSLLLVANQTPRRCGCSCCSCRPVTKDGHACATFAYRELCHLTLARRGSQTARRRRRSCGARTRRS